MQAQHDDDHSPHHAQGALVRLQELPHHGGRRPQGHEDGREPEDEEKAGEGDPARDPGRGLGAPELGEVHSADERQVAGDDREHAGGDERHQAREGGRGQGHGLPHHRTRSSIRLSQALRPVLASSYHFPSIRTRTTSAVKSLLVPQTSQEERSQEPTP